MNVSSERDDKQAQRSFSCNVCNATTEVTPTQTRPPVTLSIKMTHLWLCAQLLQQNLETNFYSGNVSWDEVSPNDAAALLKKFIRELPAPLLTAEYLNTFSAVRGQCCQLM